MSSTNQPKNPMTSDAASRIQSSNAKSGNDTGAGSFPARAQAAAAHNANTATSAGAASNGTHGTSATNGSK
ncbi:hypothetical protein PVAG01_09156 [Phlyctema vagabunda]|uniref:SMP domain-containing protein n=1 Tax=Phlyctema vagabunda TaxID=108571 RepID=A0ABR4P6K7_9HELO